MEENWCSEADPAKRRRIQNKLNQRNRRTRIHRRRVADASKPSEPGRREADTPKGTPPGTEGGNLDLATTTEGPAPWGAPLSTPPSTSPSTFLSETLPHREIRLDHTWPHAPFPSWEEVFGANGSVADSGCRQTTTMPHGPAADWDAPDCPQAERTQPVATCPSLNTAVAQDWEAVHPPCEPYGLDPCLVPSPGGPGLASPGEDGLELVPAALGTTSLTAPNGHNSQFWHECLGWPTMGAGGSGPVDPTRPPGDDCMDFSCGVDRPYADIGLGWETDPSIF
ncbi:uncharacterized protein PG986_014478 [Apiospora aurea]|uniref:BZIP domain-containing protein n=1 Tax=Apiospora aurea TaxID=335848 RepID=A0ABR1PT37_9PEZI